MPPMMYPVMSGRRVVRCSHELMVDAATAEIRNAAHVRSDGHVSSAESIVLINPDAGGEPRCPKFVNRA